MILCDREIQEALAQKRLFINPLPTAECYSSTSVDLLLGKHLRIWNPPETQVEMAVEPRFRPANEDFIYRQVEQRNTVLKAIPADGYKLGCNSFVLGYTKEKIYLPHQSRLCARVEDKSSLARLGHGVHVTAPTIHAGFGYDRSAPKRSGMVLCLEIWNVGPLPIELQPEMHICQLILEEVREVPTSGYEGQFNP